MRNFSSVRHFCFIIMSVILLSGCSTGWMQQRFHYLNKVAAVVKTERDTVKIHLDRRMEAVSQQREMAERAGDSVNNNEILAVQSDPIAAKQPGMLKFTYQEIKRITFAHSELKPGQQRGGAMAAQSENLSIWWNLFIFFVMLGLFVVLLWWAIEKKQSGCLASAIAVVAIIVLFFLALGIN